MGSFDPWLGNSNPTDQAKNDYIRRLKAALVDTQGLKIESGTYTGDASSPRDITLSNVDLRIAWIILGDNTGTKTMAISFEGMSPTSLILIDGAAPTSNATTISSLGTGVFTVNNNTYSNASGSTYYYTVFGS
jgi:hypothetical protein